MKRKGKGMAEKYTGKVYEAGRIVMTQLKNGWDFDFLEYKKMYYFSYKSLENLLNGNALARYLDGEATDQERRLIEDLKREKELVV